MRRVEKNLWPAWTILFATMSILPVMALLKMAERMDPLYIAGYLFVVWLFTAILYWRDKKRARSEEWRTPERTLHLLELLGGWGSAFWAQRFFRHKIRKVSFQVVFWMIAVLHQLLAFDFLNGWNYSEGLFSAIMAQIP